MKRTILIFVVLIFCLPALLYAQQGPIEITTKAVAWPVYMIESDWTRSSLPGFRTVSNPGRKDSLQLPSGWNWFTRACRNNNIPK